MIIYTNLGIVLAAMFLLILSIIDIYTYKAKEGYIPAALSTSMIIVALLTTPGFSGVYGGILALLLGLLFYDLDMFQGAADLKVIIACGIVLQSGLQVLMFGLVLAALSLLAKGCIKLFNRNEKTMAYIPVILGAFVLTVSILV